MAAQLHFYRFRLQSTPLMVYNSTEGGKNRVERLRFNSFDRLTVRDGGNCGSTALVTGASGYLGARLCHELLKQGYSVKAFDLKTSNVSSLTNAADAAAGSLQIVYGDVTDYASLLHAVSGCHVIFHAAAVVDHWIPDPSKFFSVSSHLIFFPITTSVFSTPVVKNKSALHLLFIFK